MNVKMTRCRPNRSASSLPEMLITGPSMLIIAASVAALQRHRRVQRLQRGAEHEERHHPRALAEQLVVVRGIAEDVGQRLAVPAAPAGNRAAPALWCIARPHPAHAASPGSPAARPAPARSRRTRTPTASPTSHRACRRRQIEMLEPSRSSRCKTPSRATVRVPSRWSVSALRPGMYVPPRPKPIRNWNNSALHSPCAKSAKPAAPRLEIMQAHR